MTGRQRTGQQRIRGCKKQNKEGREKVGRRERQDANGKPIYTQISGKNQNEINDRIVKAYIQSGRIFDFLPVGFAAAQHIVAPAQPVKHSFREYAEHWYAVFGKPNIEASTALTYRRQLDLYWIPAFGDKPVEDIQQQIYRAF